MENIKLLFGSNSCAKACRRARRCDILAGQSPLTSRHLCHLRKYGYSELKGILGFSSTHYNAMFYVSIVEAWKSFLSTSFDVIRLQRYNFLCKNSTWLCRFCSRCRRPPSWAMQSLTANSHHDRWRRGDVASHAPTIP